MILTNEAVRVTVEPMGLGAACQKGSSDSGVQMHGCECEWKIK